MRIVRTSPLSGKTNIREINVTQAQIDAWENGELIQNAMPNLSASDREFVKTGITGEEWDEVFGQEEDE